MARVLEHPGREEFTLDAVLSALSDPIRRSVVQELYETGAEQACSAFELPVSKATSTYHFRVLREAGLISQRYVGTTIQNQLRLDDVSARFPGLLDAVLDHPAGAEDGEAP
ncbi:ArsR/SmtB family transcription factor [Isoptericola sp. NPDC056134]|uniref:ArsR/SmtB family transcription factor n=1 Tax=Isoptericola sp. NPDC056134 TaxID=3345723 RepID=UPI0035E9899C